MGQLGYFTPFLGIYHILTGAEGAEEKFWPKMGVVKFPYQKGWLFLTKKKKKLRDSLKKPL